MPDFALTDQEAASLAAHLVEGNPESPRNPAELAQADAGRGQTLFRQHRCHACHSITTQPQPPAPREPVKITHTSHGCLARNEKSLGSAPRFSLTEQEARDLATLYSRERAARPPATNLELLPYAIDSLRCGACHNRDHETSPLRRIIAEESEHGVAPEGIPNLTWAGEKLHANWVRKLLEGEAPHSRPWLKSRMPAFAKSAYFLADSLAAEHGVNFSYSSQGGAFNRNRLAQGDRLTRKDGGLDCRSCHGVGKDEPTGDEKTKIAQGINFAHTRERLREEFYLRFVLDPPRHDVTTRMPKLSADGKTTAATTILEGDARKQFEAIWEFIQTARY
jgi:mono/diheme cytochrome c family protein